MFKPRVSRVKRKVISPHNIQKMDKSLQLKLMISQLPEFEFSFGDPRPILLEYILSFPEVETYLTRTQANKLQGKNIFQHRCKPSEKRADFLVRGFIPPDEKSLKKFENKLETGTCPFLAIPVMMVSTTRCKPGEMNQAKHLNIYIFNRNTSEVERIDIKKFHVSGFKIKMGYKSMKKNFKPLFQKYYNNTLFVSDHDVSSQVFRKLHTTVSKYAFPIYLIAYLHERFANPMATTEKIQTRVNKLSVKALFKYWNHYIEFRMNNPQTKCDQEHFYNMEINRCIKKNQKNLTKYAIDRPIKACAKDMIHDPLQNRCVKKEKLASINIAIDNVIAMNIKKKEMLTPIGGKNVFSSVMFVLSKHPNATLVNPLEGGQPQKKREFCVNWAYKPGDEKFHLIFPAGFWEAWNRAMMSNHRFLIILVTLTSIEGGHHANCLIYDKTNNELERFDGLGPNTADTYGLKEFDALIRTEFETRIGTHVPKGFKYFTPIDYCPRNKDVFQSKEVEQLGFDDMRGNCAVWRLWYIDIRLANPHLKRQQLVKYAMKKLEEFGNFPRFIKSYQAYVLTNIKKNANVKDASK